MRAVLSHRSFWPKETTAGDNATGRRLTVDSGVFNTDMMANGPKAGAVWANSRLRDRIDAIIAHEDAESLVRDHDLAGAMAADTTLSITDGALRFFGRSEEDHGSGDVIHYLTVGHLDPVALAEGAAVATRPLDESTVRRVLAEFPGFMAEHKDGYVVLPWHGLGPVSLTEAFALRLHELTGCSIADRRNGRLIEPAASSGKKRAAI